MDFTMNESQDAVAELVVSLLERDSARDIALWPKLVDSGLLSVALPQRYGGDGLGLLEVSAMLTELATDAVQVPALTTLGFGVLPLLRSAPESLAEKVFPAVADGAVLTAALNEPGAPFAMKPETTATVDGNTVRIRGRKVGVPYVDRARWILVPTDSGLAVVDAEVPGLERAQSPSGTGAPEFSLYFDDAEIPAEQLLSGGIPELYRYALATIGSVADGLLKGIVTLATEHLRIQDGVSRENTLAASRTIADICIASRALHAIAQSANWALAQNDDSAEHHERVDNGLDVLAYYVASELRATIRMCHHLYVADIATAHPLHRYYSQAADLARWLGGTSSGSVGLKDRFSSVAKTSDRSSEGISTGRAIADPAVV
ncbi:acyl-CoA dehydrogenase [Nocardia sp. CT2-14]|uniref:Acyl-CoA dehydrogenase n=1 Tax=Nocardia aurantiaca TaxID=2675850 RepID=A0A6I3KSP2_9NOCA|nr:acyl-CoA dehydrogenase [Nocardia aurantiaca]